MVSRDGAVADVHGFLLRAGFAASDPKDLAHAGFDIVARRDQVILVIKVVTNANSLSEVMLSSMRTLANAVRGSAIIIALRSGREELEDGVVYTRAGLPMVSLGTLRDLIEEGVPPMVYASSGGFYVELDAEALRKAREGGLSLGDIADMAGVTRRTVRMYEDGMGAKLDVALRLEEGVGRDLILPLDPLSFRERGQTPCRPDDFRGLTREIFFRLSAIGYTVNAADKCPFDAVAQDGSTVLLTGIERKRPGLDRRAKAIATLSKILEKHSVIFVDRLGERLNPEGAPIICSSELRRARDRRKVMDLIEERA